MGRRDHKFDDLEKVYLRRVPLNGDYDPGGAYWGGGFGVLPLYCAWSDSGGVMFVRASNREEAKRMVLETNDSLRFYR